MDADELLTIGGLAIFHTTFFVLSVITFDSITVFTLDSVSLWKGLAVTLM